MNTDTPNTENDQADSPATETGSDGAGPFEASGAGDSSNGTNSGSDQPPVKEPEDDSKPGRVAAAPPAEKSRSGSFFAFLAFLFAIAALAGTAWMWWQDSSGRGQEEERVFTEIARLESRDHELTMRIQQLQDGVEALPSGDASAEIEALERRLGSGISQVEQVERSMSEQLAQSRSLQVASDAMQRRLQAAESALAGMAGRELDASHDLDLAEVDYLLRLANERLNLFHDPLAADETLKLADMHLAAMNDPIYLAVRQDIATVRQALAANEVPDFFAIGSDIDTLQQSIAALPFKGEHTVALAAVSETEAGWWGKVKQVFSDLVTVRRSTELEDQRISLEDKDYVRQRLWLQLEIAHLALMRRDQESFRKALARVQQTLAEWFEENSGPYRSTDDLIKSLASREIQLEMPDISKPWSTLQQVRALRSLPAISPVAPTSEPAEPASESVQDSEG